MSSSPGEFTVMIEPVQYIVSCLPATHRERNDFSLRVTARDLAGDRWAVIDRRGYCLSATGDWTYEVQPSSRTATWLASHRFPLQRALELAADWAPRLTIGPAETPMTVADMMTDNPWKSREDRLRVQS